MKRKENLIGYAFVAPALLVFLVFVAFPFFFSLFLSLTEWNFLSGWSGIKWKGLENFAKLASDRNFRQAVINTVIYTVCTVPISILIALALAYNLNKNVYMKKTLRLAFFIPYISNMVALAAVFKFLFRDDGIINDILVRLFHLQQVPRWLSSSELNKIPIILILIWTAVGYEMIVYMAALQNVPRELYEAGKLDGATGFKQFVYITFPMISPTTFYLVIVRMISAFKVFSAINIITLGTATRGNTSLVVEIYQDAFLNYKFGYASAEAVVLFVIILVITLLNFWGQKKWVHY